MYAYIKHLWIKLTVPERINPSHLQVADHLPAAAPHHPQSVPEHTDGPPRLHESELAIVSRYSTVY